jgi:hypothetical protein
MAKMLASMTNDSTLRTARRFPMLEMIDQARGELVSPFANDQHAPLLEQLAHELTARHWSELVWVTGDVPAGAFHRVCNELERLRILFAQLASEKIVSAA